MLENVEQIRREIPAEFSLVPPDGGDVKTYEAVRTMADEITRLRAENEALREALRPFRHAADDVDAIPGFLGESVSDSTNIAGNWVGLSVGDLRRARAAYEGGGNSLQKVQRSP